MTEIIEKLKNLFKPINKNSDGYHTFDELYEHRIALFIALMHNTSPKDHRIWKSEFNSDGNKLDGWFVAGIDDKITYHLPMKYWKSLFVSEILDKGLWDGHKSSDVIERLLKLN